MTATTELPNDVAWVDALQDPAIYGLPPGERVEKLETHISHVLLAGPYAYKIKKPVDLGFLDFRSLSARRFYCDEELRLNRRFAPSLYLDVVPITGSPAAPAFAGSGPAFEYAVKMRRFAQDCLLDRMLAQGELTPAHIDELAARIATFHAAAGVASASDRFGTPDAIRQPALENFIQLRADDSGDSATLDVLERWTKQQCLLLETAFVARKRDGFVRECHGDLHLRNVALIEGRITPFDCIEFDPNLRWIDVMNEVAFVYMDLHDRRRADLAHRFLNIYLEATGDYAGLGVLRFYVVYRALVRAKIHRLRAAQPNLSASERTRLLAQYRGYLALATAQATDVRRVVIITHGLSGSGKTTLTQPLLERIGAVRVRSDVERKRLRGLSAAARTHSEIGAGAYSGNVTALTYERLGLLARVAIDAGYPVIVDATFLKRWQRDRLRDLAHAYDAAFVILDMVADEATLRARIVERQKRDVDASEADVRVLEHQIAAQEPLSSDELRSAVTWKSTDDLPAPDNAVWRSMLKKFRSPLAS